MSLGFGSSSFTITRGNTDEKFVIIGEEEVPHWTEFVNVDFFLLSHRPLYGVLQYIIFKTEDEALEFANKNLNGKFISIRHVEPAIELKLNADNAFEKEIRE